MATEVFFLRAKRLDAPPHSKGWSRMLVGATDVWVRDEDLISTADPAGRLDKHELAARLCVVAECGDVTKRMAELLRQAASYLEEDDGQDTGRTGERAQTHSRRS